MNRRLDVWLDDGAGKRYLALRSSGAIAKARRFDARVRERAWQSAQIRWRTPERNATRAARQLYRLDLEIRRATNVLRSRSFRELPPAIPLRDGGLEIREANAGSLDVVLQAVGIVSLVLLSNPVQLALTTRALVGDALRLRAWLGGRSEDDRPDLVLELPGGGRVRARHRLVIEGVSADGGIDRVEAE